MVFDANRFKAPPTSAGAPPELRSPRGDEDIRVHPQWRFDALAMAKASGKFFIIDQDLHAALAGRMGTYDLHAAITSSGKVIVWPIKQSDEVLKEAAAKATSEWTRVSWDTNNKTHGHTPAAEKHSDPVWPFQTFEDLLDVAVHGRILTDPEDETVKAILAKKRKGKI